MQSKIFEIIKQATVALCLVGIMWACADCEPVTGPGTSLVVGFYDLSAFNTTQRLAGRRVTLDSVRELSASAKYDIRNLLPTGQTAQPSQRFFLPLPIAAQEAAFVFSRTIQVGTLRTAQHDTLRVRFDRRVIYNAPDCGLYEQIEGIQILNSTFAKDTVFQSSILSNDSSNVRLYF